MKSCAEIRSGKTKKCVEFAQQMRRPRRTKTMIALKIATTQQMWRPRGAISISVDTGKNVRGGGEKMS